MKVKLGLLKITLLGACLAVLGVSTPALAAIANVTVGSGGLIFTPQITNIHSGDQVIWQWATGNHTVTSSNNAWSSTAVQSAGTSFTNTFITPGTYGYYCGPHKSFGMVGEVVVAAVPQPPTVSITNPVAGEVFAAPASVSIQASTSDSSGTVTSVQFLVGTNVVATSTTPPFAAVTNNLPAGNYNLFAIATDSNGLTATNQVPVSVVTPIVSSPGLPTQLAPHAFKFSFTGNTGLSYVFQSATNLVLPNWINLYTNQAVGGTIDYTDLDATLAGRFYRVERLSNP
jgi:plastocyanin